MAFLLLIVAYLSLAQFCSASFFILIVISYFLSTVFLFHNRVPQAINLLARLILLGKQIIDQDIWPKEMNEKT